MSEPFSYDLVEYPAYVHSQMHPSRLAAIARLHRLGLKVVMLSGDSKITAGAVARD